MCDLFKKCGKLFRHPVGVFCALLEPPHSLSFLIIGLFLCRNKRMYIPSYLLNIYVCFFKIERGANVENNFGDLWPSFYEFLKVLQNNLIFNESSGSQNAWVFRAEASRRLYKGAQAGRTMEFRGPVGGQQEGEEEHKDLTRLMTQRGRRICVPVAARFKNRTVARVRMNLLGNFHNMMWCFCSQTRRLTTMSFESFKQSSLALQLFVGTKQDRASQLWTFRSRLSPNGYACYTHTQVQHIWAQESWFLSSRSTRTMVLVLLQHKNRDFCVATTQELR